MKAFISIIVIVACALFNSKAQDMVKCDEKYFSDTLLEKLCGHWQLTGHIGQKKIENNFSAEWVLGHQFIQLNFEDIAVPATYFAHVYVGYDCISERYIGHWIDNYGGRFSETLGYGTRKDNAIIFRFEYPDGPFINTISYDSKINEWQLHMTTKNAKGEWVLFGDEYLKQIK